MVNRNWDKFIFGLARLQSVVDLLADWPDALFALRHTESFHQMPAGKVGQADIADLARPDEAVESLKGFFERSLTIPLVQLIEIYTVGT